MGRGPVVLLAHGTGASTHSWREMMPLLARHFTVVAPDLPGHGFTDSPRQSELSLPWMARALSQLMDAMRLEPDLAVGHSAGAAILIRACLDGAMAPRALVSVNGALLPFKSWGTQVISPLAKLLAAAPLVPDIFAWRAGSRAAVERLIRGTGSDISSEGMDLYSRLFQSRKHVAAALGMMANWDLETLARELPRLRVPLVMLAGGEDRAIAPEETFRVRELVQGAEAIYLRGVGHLAHEERPQAVADIVVEAARARALAKAG
jgi:magnesium chelatase accessory protein